MPVEIKGNMSKTKWHSKIIHLVVALVLVLSLGLVMTPLARVGADAQTEEFTESATFIVPETVTEITVQAWGGGGAGGGSTNPHRAARGGAGGGGGAYASSTLTVEPGQELQVVVGAGVTGVSGANGNAGSPSFAGPDTNPANALVRAAAGSGGTGNTAGGSPAGGAGGTVEDSIGQTRIAGANGGNGATGYHISSGAGGAGAYGGGSGGAAVTEGTSNGNPGNLPGGGGGGALTWQNEGNRAGGAGAAGKVVISWVTYDLTISSTGGGSVTEPGEGVFPYGKEAVVDLIAEADVCYEFINWTGDVDTIADVYAASTNITMGAAKNVTANFALLSYNLTADSTDGGSITDPGEGTFTYDCGDVVNLVAETEEGYRFVEWTGNVGTIADVYDATTTITMDGDYSITAEFVKQYDLTTSSTEGGSVTTPGEGVFSYDDGTLVDLVAEAEENYRFVEWTGDVGTIADIYDATTTITMDGDYSIIANFVKQYDLTISSIEGGSVITPGEGVFTYDEGKVVDLVAEAEENYQFDEWNGDVGTIADIYDAETTITMNGDYSITANFEEVPPSPVYPTVTTKAVTGTSTNSTTLNMNYTVGDFGPVQVRFAYKKSTGSSWSYTDWVSKAGSGTYAAPLTGLDSDTTYDFKAQLKYDATVIGGTILQFTTDTPSTPPPTGGCFIATAAYGTPTAEQIDVLREFRDTVLLESTAGSQFVALYYRFSPPVADFISESSFLRTLVRELMVDPIVWVVEATEDIWRN